MLVLCVLYSTKKRQTAGQSGHRNKYRRSTNTVHRIQRKIPVGVRFSAPVQTGTVAHPASFKMGTGSFSRG